MPDSPSNPCNPCNPCKVPPATGDMTFAALEPATPAQLAQIGYLRRLCGNPLTWADTCRLILGDDYDGDPKSLSKYAASYLIHGLQAALVATADADDDLQLEVGHA